MFGLNDSETQVQNTLPAEPFVAAVSDDDINLTPPIPMPMFNHNPPATPVTSSPVVDPAHAASVHSSGSALPGADALAKSINLENAYIPSLPPQLAGKTDAPAKPTAALLMNNTPSDDLLKIKQQALTSLAPLVDHLDQTPEEKFKTTMMLIQASDNAELVPEAYDAANKISDQKVRAQALLDVVNEINYFTQHGINAAEQKPTT